MTYFPSLSVLFIIIYNQTFSDIFIRMGAMECCSGNGNKQTVRSLEYEFGEDGLQHGIAHHDRICNFFLQDCEERLRKSNSLYKDPTLSTEPLILKQSNDTDQIKCSFSRPYYFLKEKKGAPYKILHQEIVTYCDININHDALQYFSMFLCFLADKPNLIKEIMLTPPNSYGIHAVAMYANGQRKEVFIDDYILCYQAKPIFSQPIKGKYMWPCLIEKAWLKVKGYVSDKILVTSPVDVFRHFLLYPFESYNISLLKEAAYEQFKKAVLIREDSSFIVTSKKEPLHKIGLSGRKNYFLRSYFQFQGKYYYYLRNPCGSFDFRGKYRIIFKQLQAKIEKQTGEKEITEGNFILEEGEFVQQIQEVLVVHYNKNSLIVSEESLKSNGKDDIYIKFTLNFEQQVSISFLQEQLQGKNTFDPVTYQIINERQHRLVSGLNNQDGCFGVPSTNLLGKPYLKLPPGQYLIRLKKKPIKHQNGESSLTNEANDKVVITASRKIPVDYAMTQLYQKRFYEFLLNYCSREMGKKIGESRNRGKQTEHSSFWLGDLVIIYIKRLDKSKEKINIEVNFPDKINLECLSHSLSSQFAVVSFIEEQMLIIFEKIDLAEQTILGKYSIQAF